MLGVCGSIAAYKAAILTRLLVKAGAEVKVIMTSSALDFITPLTLSTLSKNPVLMNFQDKGSGTWNSHVDLGLWADILLVAPASANSIAKFAHGICDNLLTAVYLSARCPVYLAPAMDVDMYLHPSTQNNLGILRRYSNQIIEPERGELASGLSGPGRMSEPEKIIEILEEDIEGESKLNGKTVLITAGPTQEAIDPVRFIGNHSSGKMGYALARKMAAKGAEVKLVTGPTAQRLNHSAIEVIDVTSAEEMYKACKKIFPKTDITILAAAVADYRPTKSSRQKIKKKGEKLALDLEKTVDIASELGKLKKKNQLIVGFALETENELSNAKKKLSNKNFDLIVLNSLNDPGAGFSHDTNKVTIIQKSGEIHKFDLKSKDDVAEDIYRLMMDSYESQ